MKNKRNIYIVSIIVLAIIVYLMVNILKDPIINLIGFIILSLSVIIFFIFKIIDYGKQKRWLYVTLILILLLIYSFISITNYTIVVEKDKTFGELMEIIDLRLIEKDEKNKKRLNDQFIELSKKMDDLNDKHSVYFPLGYITFAIILFIPYPRKEN